MPTSKLLWGSGYENEVVFDYPLFDILTDREPVEGSAWARGAAGVEDSWITGRDYTLQCQARWIPDGGQAGTPVSGGGNFQEFLDYARDAGALRFVPDADYPDFYLPDTYLVEPKRGFGGLTSDLLRQVNLKLRNPTYDFHQALRGLMLEYRPGADLVPYAFSRTSIGRYTAHGGTIEQLAAAVLRDRHWMNGERMTLLESARTNLVLYSDALSNWTSSGTPTATDDAISLGDLGLCLLGDDDGGAAEYKRIDVGFTGDAVKAISCFVKIGTSPPASGSRVVLYDSSASVERLRADITWAGAVPQVSMVSGVQLGSAELVSDGVYRLRFQATSVVAANTNRIWAVPAPTPSETGNIYMGGVQAEDAPVPSSPIITNGATVTRSADRLTRSWPWPPQTMWAYAKFVELGSIATAGYPRVVDISLTAPRIDIYRSDGTARYAVDHYNGVTNVAAALAVAPTYGDLVELLALWYADGSVQLKQSVNGAAETATSRSAALSFASAYGDGTPAVALNSDPGGSAVGLNGFQHVKVGVGTAVSSIAAARLA